MYDSLMTHTVRNTICRFLFAAVCVCVCGHTVHSDVHMYTGSVRTECPNIADHWKTDSTTNLQFVTLLLVEVRMTMFVIFFKPLCSAAIGQPFD